MPVDRKIHIKNAPPHVQALANFVEEANDRNMQVEFRPTDLDGGGTVTATDGQTVVTGQLSREGHLRIRKIK